MIKKNFKFTGQSGLNRLDTFLQKSFPEFSRTSLQKKIRTGQIKVDGKIVKPSYQLSEGENVSLSFTLPLKSELCPEAIPLKIVFEDSHLIVIDKQAGLVTHPAKSCPEHTLVNAVLYHCPDLKGIGGVERPGIVHRLDKDTSGLIVVAKHEKSYQGLKKQWEKRSIEREYLALCAGHWDEPRLLVEAPIGRDANNRKKMAVTAKNARPASTLFTLLEDLDDFSYLKAELKTGRTHQIRVHLAYLKHPILGDQLYSTPKLRKFLPRQALHAHRLGFTHPVTGEVIDLYSELPKDMATLLDTLRKQIKSV